MGMENDIAVLIRRAGIRADEAEKRRDWDALEKWSTEALREIDREAAEATPYATDSAQNQLAEARSHLKTP